MSRYRTTIHTVYCDASLQQGGKCYQSHETIGGTGAAAARAQKNDGWKRSDGKDSCPEHAKGPEATDA